MLYRNRCKDCDLEEDEQRPLADYNKPGLCTACSGETEMVVSGARVVPFPDGLNHGRMK